MAHHPRPLEVAASLRSALQRYYRVTEEICRKARLTPEQYTLLMMIKTLCATQPEGAPVGEIARRMELSRNGMTERIRRAEEAGLVRRSRDPNDRRVFLIRLSSQGERRFAQAFGELGKESDRFIAAIADIDRDDRTRTTKQQERNLSRG
jgi:DNA-binding MarR family transcriptional regulator